MPRTWIDNPALEGALLEVFTEVDKTFSLSFDTQALSNEERLTGDLVRLLQERAKGLHDLVATWSKGSKMPVYFNLSCTDTTADRNEQFNGADLAFILTVNVPNQMKREKTIFVQAKKMNSTGLSKGVTFHYSWDIDKTQLSHLKETTQFGYYFLYGPTYDSTNIRVIPAGTIDGIMVASRAKTVIQQNQVMPSSRTFAEFLVYDFIACWAGDERKEAIRKARGEDVQFPVRHIIEVALTAG